MTGRFQECRPNPTLSQLGPTSPPLAGTHSCSGTSLIGGLPMTFRFSPRRVSRGYGSDTGRAAAARDRGLPRPQGPRTRYHDHVSDPAPVVPESRRTVGRWSGLCTEGRLCRVRGERPLPADKRSPRRRSRPKAPTLGTRSSVDVRGRGLRTGLSTVSVPWKVATRPAPADFPRLTKLDPHITESCPQLSP